MVWKFRGYYRNVFVRFLIETFLFRFRHFTQNREFIGSENVSILVVFTLSEKNHKKHYHFVDEFV